MLVGAPALWFGIAEFHRQSQFVADAERADGEVTKVTRMTRTAIRHGTSTHYAYQVRFRTSAGTAIDENAAETSSSPRFIEGEKVGVLYLRERPREFQVDTFEMLWANTVVLLTIAGVFLGAGATAFYIAGGKSTRRGRSAATLPEVARAWSEGRLTRDSEYQGLLIAFAFAGFPIAGGILVFILFAPGIVQVIIGGMLLWIAIQVFRQRRAAARGKPPGPRNAPPGR
jgi:hypothetical protein